MRKTYEMTKAQLDTLLDACKSTPVMMISGSCGRSPQEKANDAWAVLGKELNFDPMTVEPIQGKEMWWFTAEESPPPKPALPSHEKVLKDLLFQLKDGGWVDKIGHPIELNTVYQLAVQVSNEGQK